MTEDKKRKIIDRIAKLLALGDKGRGGSQHETELALLRAQQLMEQHNISLGEVPDSDGANRKTGPKFNVTQGEAYSWIGLRDYQHLLSRVVAKVTTTEPLTRHRYVPRTYAGKTKNVLKDFVLFVGEETDVAIACSMYPALVKTIHTATRLDIGPGYGRRQRSYCEGFVMALWEKVQSYQPPENQTYAMVVSGKALATQTWIDENLNVRATPSKKKRSTDDDTARWMGYQKGTEQDLGTKNRLS